MLYENENLKKNKHAAEILVTCALPIKIICRPTKSRETIPLKNWEYVIVCRYTYMEISNLYLY